MMVISFCGEVYFISPAIRGCEPSSTITPFIERLLSSKKPIRQPAGVASQRHVRLDRGHPPCSQLSIALNERCRAMRQFPRDAHQGVAMLGQSLARDAPTPVDSSRLI